MYAEPQGMLKVRINCAEGDNIYKEHRNKVYKIGSVYKQCPTSIGTMAVAIAKEIGIEKDPSVFEYSNARLYSQEGIQLNDSDLYFLNNYGTLYLDIHGKPFNYQQILHQYKMGKKLGEGSFGVVYKIVEKLTDKPYAMKVVEVGGFFNKASTAENLFREQKALLQLNHNHVVKLYNSFIVKDKICQIMQLWAGGELRKYLLKKPNNRVSEKEARFLILQICRGISYCHQKGIIHRDIKPENILIESEINQSDDTLGKILRS